MYTIFISFMIFLGRHRYTSWRTKMNYSTSSRNSKPWLRTTLKRRSRPFDQIMAENSHKNEFKELCKDPGIKRELTAPYNPWQNGVAERKNRTIMEATRAMLHDQDLPMHLWAKAARTIVYVHNRTPHRVLENKTPEEIFFGKKPEVNHLRISSCPIYI